MADESAPVTGPTQPRNLVRELIDSGIHFGHRASRWNPKMEPFIYGKRNKIHIIDVRETLKGLLRAKKLVAQLVASNEDIVFVGTKRQAKLAVKEQADRCGMPYVNERWLGGTLTNFRTIRSRLGRLEELETLDESGRIEKESKKEASSLRREKRKIQRNLGGIRTMGKLPAAMVVIDVRREHIAVKEAQKIGVATIALIDTDSDPDYADLPIPGNDDAMRGIELILSELADAVIEGKTQRVAAGDKGAQDAGAPRPRRTRRMTTSQQYEQQLTPTEQKLATPPPSVMEVVPSGEPAPEAAAEPEPAPQAKPEGTEPGATA
ncbi:MAG: 30S ribosomal protein S2 [Phycisphaerae bacterium]|nr:30S ribosomal protein S2 [Phycisphaerae bacterium]